MYKPILFQKLTTNAVVKDSAAWNIYASSMPFNLSPKAKELPKRSRPDRNGDDEYVPDAMFYEAYEMDVVFVYCIPTTKATGTTGISNTDIKGFLDYIKTGGMFKIYDTYTQIGRTNVRYVDFKPKMFFRREGINDVVEFTVTLKVNDPVTDITLTKA